MNTDIIFQEYDKIFKRHLARTLSGLNELNMPEMVVGGVKSNMEWLIKDLKEKLKEYKNG